MTRIADPTAAEVAELAFRLGSEELQNAALGNLMSAMIEAERQRARLAVPDREDQQDDE